MRIDKVRDARLALAAEEARRRARDLPSAVELAMTICSEKLHELVVEQRLHAPAIPTSTGTPGTRSPAQTPRGGRLGKASDSAQSDALIAVAIAVERASAPAYTPKFLGFA